MSGLLFICLPLPPCLRNRSGDSLNEGNRAGGRNGFARPRRCLASIRPFSTSAGTRRIHYQSETGLSQFPGAAILTK